MSTKIHQLVDGRKRPLTITLTAGQAADSPVLKFLLADLAVKRPGPGRPRTRPEAVLGDKAYSGRGNRTLLRSKRITAVIPQPGNLFRLMTPAQQQVLFENTARSLGGASKAIQERHIAHCT